MYVLSPPLRINNIPNPYLLFTAECLHEARKMLKYIALCRIHVYYYTGCPTRYRTRHFFNNFTTNEDIATKIEEGKSHCVGNVTTS